MGLFGSELRVTNGFSKTYSEFASETKRAKSDIDGLKSSIKDTESATGSAFGSMKSQAMSLASEYRKLGLTQSEALKKAWSEIERTSKNSSKNVGNDWKSSFDGIGKSADNLLSKVTKLAAGYLSLKGAISGFKTTIGEASNFQNASVFLNAVYGEQQGKQKYKFATQEANNTPFSESEVANGLARAHSLNLKDDSKSFKMYEDLGSFAKIQGVGDLSSAIDAISDMQGGEWERLQTITGIKRTQLEKFANENGIGTFTNKSGQVTDPDKAIEALQAYMDKKGITGMTDKFSKTFSGRMSTLKGNASKALAEVAGIQDDGTVKKGSLFDNASKGMERIITSVNNFSKSESFDKISDGLGKLGNNIIKGFDYLTEHPETGDIIVKVGSALVGLKVASSVVSPIVGLASGISKFTSVSNVASTGALGLNKSLGLLGVGIMGLESLINESGLLHKGFNNTANAIMGNSKAEGTMHDYVNEGIAGIQEFGLSGINTFAKITGNDNLQRWVNDTWRDIETGVANSNSRINGANILSDSQKDMWYSAKDVADTKNISNNATNNYNTNVSVNVDTIRETADVDDIANQLATKINKVHNTRNAIGYLG